MTVRIITGDCREVLKTLESESVHCCVTSPPYFGLRDYGVAGQIGLEDNPATFVEQMVGVFQEVRRVLRDDGTLWLNLGDSYANDTKWGGQTSGKHVQANHGNTGIGRRRQNTGLKSKDLIGIPWRVAFALQADGWYLRQDIIWSKPNPMPESVTDRCTKAHEYIFLLSKSPRYFFDTKATTEAAVYSGLANQDESGFKNPMSFEGKHKDGYNSSAPRSARDSFKREGSKREQVIPGQTAGTHRPDREEGDWNTATRNKRSVWTVATAPFKEAHFATFPPALIEPCILAGCPTGGMVLDPFGGAGTTGMVADRLGRNATLIELNPEYVALSERRLEQDAGMFHNIAAQ